MARVRSCSLRSATAGEKPVECPLHAGVDAPWDREQAQQWQ